MVSIKFAFWDPSRAQWRSATQASCAHRVHPIMHSWPLCCCSARFLPHLQLLARLRAARLLAAQALAPRLAAAGTNEPWAKGGASWRVRACRGCLPDAAASFLYYAPPPPPPSRAPTVLRSPLFEQRTSPDFIDRSALSGGLSRTKEASGSLQIAMRREQRGSKLG